MPRVRAIFSALAVLACTACASVDETPSTAGPRVFKDDYDGATIVRQAPVASGSGTTGDNALGFEWKSKFPNRVILLAGTRGVIRITGLNLEIDGDATQVHVASELTEYGDASAPERWSMRRFEVSWADFKRMASARSVRMQVVGANEVFVTAFGKDALGAPVNRTLPPFFAKVRALRGEAPD
jgi:hypothetical protein